MKDSSANALVVRLEACARKDVARVGGKNASLGELINALEPHGVNVPPGFATTADAYWHFVEANGLKPRIKEALGELEAGRRTLSETGSQIRDAVLRGAWPDDLASRITAHYAELSEKMGREGASVAVRSSATAEDLPDASFAGQQETFLNISGTAALLDACRKCYASLFTDRAISYRQAKGFDHMKVALSIGVQAMVRSDKGGSGVAFSIDTETGFDKVAVINAAWGLGENVVQGAVDPDEYVVFKPFLADASLAPVIEKRLGAKEKKMIYASGDNPTRNVPTSKIERETFVLADEDILTLGRWIVAIENHYRCPMDIEWAKDGETGDLYIVQARPETVQSRRDRSLLKTYEIRSKGPMLVKGLSIGDAVVAGRVCLIETAADIDRFVDGSILVTRTTDPDWVPIMKRAVGIVTDHGGRTSHAAIVSRELGLPAVVGTGDATRRLHGEQDVTLSCAEGDEGFVYEGTADFSSATVSLDDIATTRTKVMMNLANPAAAFRWWQLPADGVGLARMEFVISNHIRVHPMALLKFDELKDEAAKSEIAELTARYEDKSEYFVELAVPRARPDRRDRPPQARHHPHERLQDERVRRASRRSGIRAEGREPDDRLPGRVALLLAGVPGRVRARMPRHRAAAHAVGLHERYRHDPVLPVHPRGRPGARGHGRERAEAGRGRVAGLCDVRDPLQRHPGEGVCRPLRRILHRFE